MEPIQNKKIFLTGGTGFIGKPLSEAFRALGASVFILSRASTSGGIRGVNRIDSLDALHEIQPDIILNLAGESLFQPWIDHPFYSSKKRIFQSRIHTTQKIVHFIQETQKKPSVFISASAVGYYGPHNTQAFFETTPICPSSYFTQSLCQAWEKAALLTHTQGVRTVVFRLGIVLGKHGGLIQKALIPFLMGLGGKFGSGKQWMSWIDQDDLIRLFFFVLDHPSIEGPLNATAPHPIQNHVFVKEFASVLNRPCLFSYPKGLIEFFMGEMGKEMLLSGQKVLPQKALQNGFTFLYPTLNTSLKKHFKI